MAQYTHVGHVNVVNSQEMSNLIFSNIKKKILEHTLLMLWKVLKGLNPGPTEPRYALPLQTV